MFIDSTTGKRVNIYAPYVSNQGVRFSDLTNPQVRLELNIVEQAEPEPPQDYNEWDYFRTEIDDAPYVVYTRRSQLVIDKAHNERVLAQIEAKEVASKMNRTVREQLIETTIERAAAKFGVTLAQAEAGLYANNLAFKRFKDLDTEIANLRATLRTIPQED